MEDVGPEFKQPRLDEPNGSPSCSVAIYGCGAVGLTLAGLLARAGQRPTLIARGARLARLRTPGLSLRFAGENIEVAVPDINPVAPGEAPDRCPDLLLLCLKGHQIESALHDLVRWIGPHTVVANGQNGIPYWYCQGPSAGLAEGRVLSSIAGSVVESLMARGRAHLGCVMYLTCTESDQALGPIRICCSSIKKIVLGASRSGVAEEGAASEIATLLTGGGIPGVEVSSCIRKDVWIKLLGNGGCNPVSALTLQPLGYLINSAHTLQVLRSVMQEMLRVATSLGVFCEGEVDVEARIALTRSAPAGFRTSMLQDVEAGRAPEVGPLLGTVVDLAELVGVEVPTLSLLYALIRSRADALAAVAPLTAARGA